MKTGLFSHHGSDQAFMAARFLEIFPHACLKKRLNTDRLLDASGGCSTISAPSDINRSIRNTHILHTPPSQTHVLDPYIPQQVKVKDRTAACTFGLLPFIIGKKACVCVSYVHVLAPVFTSH